MTKFIPLNGNSQKLDGGAMFGHVPKALWSKWIAADSENRIPLSCRALLVQEPNRNILLETGIGSFFEPHLKDRFGVIESHHVLVESLERVGLSHTDIDVVILSHLHFDHAGGLLSSWKENELPTLLFPNAYYVVGKEHWLRACQPHVRDRASFVPQLNELLQKSDRLILVEHNQHELLGESYEFLFTHGHTPGLMHTVITFPNEKPIIFASDLIPGSAWIHLPVGMGYDRSAELLIDEKKAMLDFAISRYAQLFYTHDPDVAMSGVKLENNKYVAINHRC